MQPKDYLCLFTILLLDLNLDMCLCLKDLRKQIRLLPRLVLSNGPIVSAVSQILCYCVHTGKWIMLFIFTETVLTFNLSFQHIGRNLQEVKRTKCIFRKSEKIWSRNNITNL